MQSKGMGRYDETVNSIFGYPHLYDGEKHAIMWTDQGFKPANFSGPGTNLAHRIRKGDRGLNVTDNTANAHDLRYSLARSNADIRDADIKMIKKLEEAERLGTDYRINTMPSKYGIKAKVWLEDHGVPPEWFTSYGRDAHSPEDIKLFEDRLRELEQEGYGGKKTKKKTMTAWNMHVRMTKQAHPELSFKKALKRASMTYKK
jgi:hypothetical protein